MDDLLPPIRDGRPKKLGENIRNWRKAKGKDSETKVSSLTLVKPGEPQEGLARRKIST